MTATATTATVEDGQLAVSEPANDGHHPAWQGPRLQQVVEDDLERPRLEQRCRGFARRTCERQRHGLPMRPQETEDREAASSQHLEQLRCAASRPRVYASTSDGENPLARKQSLICSTDNCPSRSPTHRASSMGMPLTMLSMRVRER